MRATSGAATLGAGATKAWARGSSHAFQPPSVHRAYEYLTRAMDAYQQGPTPRLVQSFSDSQELASTAFVYDNALAILAYLERGTGDDMTRAMLLGDSLLYAQTHDGTYDDGRLRQAYWAGPFTLL